MKFRRYLSKINLATTLKMLDELGYKEGSDYFIEDVLRVETYYECSNTRVITRSDYESRNFDSDRGNIEVGSEIHSDESVIGHLLTDEESHIIDLDKVDDMARQHRVLIARNRCSVCGTKVVREGSRGDDAREEEDGMKCFDHRGVPAVGISPEKLWVKPTLPIIIEEKKEVCQIKR